jgi:hypothetical protein
MAMDPMRVVEVMLGIPACECSARSVAVMGRYRDRDLDDRGTIPGLRQSG